MKTLTAELSREFESIELHVFADDHIGDSHTNLNVIKKRIEAVKSKPNAFVVLNGDAINNAIANSKSDIYSENRHPTEAIQFVAKLYEPVWDRVLAILPGNHEARSWRAAGIDPAQILALELGLSDVYSPEPVLLFIRFGACARRNSDRRPVTYMVYVAHGTGGGKKPGSKLGRAYELASIVDSDVYIMGHTHLPGVYKLDYIRTTPATFGVAQITKTFVSTASALNYGGYGSVSGYTPASKANPIIRLDGHKKEVIVEL